MKIASQASRSCEGVRGVVPTDHCRAAVHADRSATIFASNETIIYICFFKLRSYLAVGACEEKSERATSKRSGRAISLVSKSRLASSFSRAVVKPVLYDRLASTKYGPTPPTKTSLSAKRANCGSTTD